MAQRGVTVTYETIRQWCRTFEPAYARTLRRHRGPMGDTWYLDDLFVTIQGRQQYLWRAVENLFRVGRHLLRSAHHRLLRREAFREWDAVTCGC